MTSGRPVHAPASRSEGRRRDPRPAGPRRGVGRRRRRRLAAANGGRRTADPAADVPVRPRALLDRGGPPASGERHRRPSRPSGRGRAGARHGRSASAQPAAATASPQGPHRGEITVILAELSGLEPAVARPGATFTELGFDSLFLTQANAQFRQAVRGPRHARSAARRRIRRSMPSRATSTASSSPRRSRLRSRSPLPSRPLRPSQPLARRPPGCRRRRAQPTFRAGHP